MLRKIALILSIILMTIYANAQEVCEPEQIEFANGKYQVVLNTECEETNALIIFPDKPLMNDRFAKYGDIITDPKTGQRSANVEHKDKLTPKGLEIYDSLIRLQDPNGFYIFQAIIVRYDMATVVKYDRFNYHDWIEKILKVFE